MEDCNENVIPEKKRKCFCPITFRQEIKGKDVIKSLKKFITQASQGDDDVLLEYLKSGGSISEILSLIDVTAKGDLTTALPVFEIILLIFLRFQSIDSEYHKQCIEGSKSILQTHILAIQSMLAMNTAKHRKVALKLLSTIVTLHSSFASEIINTFLPSSQMITNFIQPSPEKDSVRKHFILFVLSFVLEGNPVILKNIISNKGFLTSIFPGLKYDSVDTVNMVLSLVEDKILKNPKISKTLKLKVFHTQTIKSLFDLYDWKGLQGIKELTATKKTKLMEINEKEKNLIEEHVNSFLILLCTSTKYGIAFQDKSLGLSDTLNNQLLFSVIETLPNPLSHKKMAEVLLKILVNCPDLLKPTLIKLEPFFQPRSSKNWFEAIEFAENLIKELDTIHKLKNSEEPYSATYMLKVMKSLCAPLVFLKTARLGFDKDQTLEIQIASLQLLATMWKKTCQLKSVFNKDMSALKKGISGYLSKFVPQPEELVKLWYNLCDREYIQNSSISLEKFPSYLSVVLEVLQMSIECQKENISSPLVLVNDLLSHFDQLKNIFQESEDLNRVQVKIVHFVENDLSSLTPDKPLFEKTIQILLKNDDDVSLSCASRVLSNLKIFTLNKSEIDVWLHCFVELPYEYRPAVSHFIIDSIIKSFKTNYADNVEIVTENDSLDKQNKEFLTPFIHCCIENFINSDSNEVGRRFYQHYLKDVLIHLQHYYPENDEFFKYVKPLKSFLGKPFVEYFKDWKNSMLKTDNLEIINCSIEQKLISWILNKKDKRKIEEILSLDLEFLKLNQLFRALIAYLVKKTNNNEIDEIDILKFSESLSFLLKSNECLEECEEYVISQKLKNFSVFFNANVHCVFLSKSLLKAFNVFTKNNCKYSSEIIVKVFMSNKNVKKKVINDVAIDVWKSKFLRQLKAKLKKNKSIEYDYLEVVLNFFQFHQLDVVEMIEHLVNVSDLTLYLHDDSPSKWAVVFVKFIQLHCLKDELNEKTVKKLCDLMKYLNEVCSNNLELLDSCFVYLLKAHPSHLMLIENEFVNVILKRASTLDSVMVGKLLLNDPTKVKYFVSILPEYLESDLILPLLSAVIVENDEFLEAIKSEQTCMYWKASEISPNSSLKLFKKLKTVYQRYEENILRALTGEKEDIILNNLPIIKILVKLFLEKSAVKKIRKKIFKEEFQPELLFAAIKKLNLVELIETFIKEMLKRFCKLIRSTKEFEENFWHKHCSLLSEVIELSESSSAGIEKCSEWEEFFKLALGLCLSCSKYASLMKIIRLLITTQRADDSKSMGFYFQMLISHSQFLNTIFGHSLLKNELVCLLKVLICRCKSEMSLQHIPILLASYTCSLSHTDRTLLEILKFYESNGFSLAEYEPLVWGENAISHYSIGTNSKLYLWQRFSMLNVLDMLDSHKMDISLEEFPIYRSLEVNDTSLTDSSTDIYDPAFLLPLFVNLLSPGSVIYPLPFVYKGGLAYTIRALSSESYEMRSIASVVLIRFYNHLELTQNLKQKMVWMHFINGFRYGIKDLSVSPVPNIITLFFAKMTLEVSQNSFEMYLPLQKFLLAKPYFSFSSIPEFLPLFHSSEVHHKKHRHWLLNILKNGTKTNQDLSIIFYSMAFKVIFCFFQSQLCDIETKKLILQTLDKFLDAKKSELLITEYGLINWIKSIDFNAHVAILPDLIKLLYSVSNVIIAGIKRKDSKFSSLALIIQILNIIVELLPSIDSLKSVEAFLIYLKIIYNCSILFIGEENCDWFKFNKQTLQYLIKHGTDILKIKDDYSRFCNLPFYFRNFNDVSDKEILKYFTHVIFLFNLLIKKSKDLNK